MEYWRLQFFSGKTFKYTDKKGRERVFDKNIPSHMNHEKTVGKSEAGEFSCDDLDEGILKQEKKVQIPPRTKTKREKRFSRIDADIKSSHLRRTSSADVWLVPRKLSRFGVKEKSSFCRLEINENISCIRGTDEGERSPISFSLLVLSQSSPAKKSVKLLITNN